MGRVGSRFRIFFGQTRTKPTGLKAVWIHRVAHWRLNYQIAIFFLQKRTKNQREQKQKKGLEQDKPIKEDEDLKSRILLTQRNHFYRK